MSLEYLVFGGPDCHSAHDTNEKERPFAEDVDGAATVLTAKGSC
jgi:hypothetical protein